MWRDRECVFGFPRARETCSPWRGASSAPRFWTYTVNTAPSCVATLYWWLTPMYVVIVTVPTMPFMPAGDVAAAGDLDLLRPNADLQAVPASAGIRRPGTVTAPPLVSETVLMPSFDSLTSPSRRLEAPRNPATNSVDGFS